MSTTTEPTRRSCGLSCSRQATFHAFGRTGRRACRPNIRSTRLGGCSAQITSGLVSLLFGLSVLLVASPVAAADCRVSGWTTGYGSHPVFECPGNPHNDTPGSSPR